MMNLEEKRIVIIGGSSGIGLATAKAAAAKGARVVIASRSPEKLRKAATGIQEKVEIFTVDVTSEESVKAFFDAVGDFDHLATPGNEAVRGPFLELDSRKARAAFDSKFWGQYHAAKYGTPKLHAGGSITLFAGAYSQRPTPGASVVAAINSAIEGLGRALAVELSPIRVNVISAGVVDTPLYAGLEEEKRAAMFKAVASSLPVKRIGKPEDIAQMVLFLMDNGFTTGNTFFIDGGYTLR